MDLADALGDSNNRPAGSAAWPAKSGASAQANWPGPSGGGGMFPGGPSGGGGAYPGGPSGGGWMFPGGPQGGGGTYPGGPSGGGGMFPGGPSGGGGTYPGGPSGGGWMFPGGHSGGGGMFPGGPSGGGGPSPCPNPGRWPSAGPGHGPAFSNLTVPYSQVLQGGVCDKMLITICGAIKPNAVKITVDLATSHDLAFHFNPRFNEAGRKVIVRNSRIRGQWGREERELPHFPFVQGQAFEIKILCTNTEFKVAVNNSHLLEYKHRIPNLSAITGLSIHNDLTLSKVTVEKMH